MHILYAFSIEIIEPMTQADFDGKTMQQSASLLQATLIQTLHVADILWQRINLISKVDSYIRIY